MIKLSIVVVAYKNMDCLTSCLESIPHLPWLEVIVVNNSHQNRGFSRGCNLGAKQAQGEYLLFLNPDCVVNEKALERIIEVLEADESIGIVGPKLTNLEGKAYSSCNMPPSRSSAPIVYSFLNRWLSKLSIVQNYWLHFKPPAVATDVGTVSGAAMGIRKEVFDKVNGFDERFFLYWEEFDLAIRVSKNGYRVVFDPSITMIHEGELSTTQPHLQVLQWFRESRYYFFKKHFGTLYASLLEGWLTLTEEWRYLLGVFFIIGFGWWFYLHGWWLGLGYVPYWKMWLDTSWWSLQTGYWLGIVGALFFMTMVFNELKKTSRKVSVGVCLLFGLWAVMIPVMGPLLLLIGLLWIVSDLIKRLLWLRKSLVVLSIVIMLLASIRLVTQSFVNRGYVTSLSTWNQVALLVGRTGKPISIRCVGCVSTTELLPLTWLMRQTGIQTNSLGSETLYLFLPPFTNETNLLPDAILIRVGDIVLARPLSNL